MASQHFSLGAALFFLCTCASGWQVVFWSSGQRHSLKVSESQPLLLAAEAAGLLPDAACRRGSCLSCAARVLAGAPFSLKTESATALCDEAHGAGLVLLCSSFVCGEGLELQLDENAEAWEMQHCLRWQRPRPAAAASERPRVHFREHERIEYLERCRAIDE